MLRLSCPERARVFGDWIVAQYAGGRAATGVTLDVAGGKGELALILTLAGRKCVLVDPRESSLKRRQRKQLRRSGRKMIETERVEFGTEHPSSVEATARLSKLAGLMVGLHPDQAAGAIVDTAIATQVPFAVIPCCVFARLFPDRAVGGINVTTNSLLCLWLMAKHPAVRATRLPFGGQNLVLYVKSYDDDGPDQETDAIKHVLANKGLDDPSEMAHPA